MRKGLRGRREGRGRKSNTEIRATGEGKLLTSFVLPEDKILFPGRGQKRRWEDKLSSS